LVSLPTFEIQRAPAGVRFSSFFLFLNIGDFITSDNEVNSHEKISMAFELIADVPGIALSLKRLARKIGYCRIILLKQS